MNIRNIFSMLTIGFLLIFSGCTDTDTQPQTQASHRTVPSQTSQAETEPSASASPSFQEQAKALLAEMSLEEKVWQMFFVRPEDITGIGIAIQAGDATQQALEQYPVGGLVYFSQNIKSRDQLTEMIQNSQNYSKIPLFISVDEEGGRVARLGDANIGVTQHPPMAQIGAGGDPGRAEKIGKTLGRELKELGFNMDFAPVADIITVDSNQDIGDRSFGKDPETVAQMVAAEVRGLQAEGVSATLKHFPSNGSTAANTHEGTGICTRTLEEMRSAEFVPFRAGIDAGADLVMVAHMSAVNLSGDETPATLSKAVVTDLLREELGFSGVIISDALNMGAITNRYTAAEAAEAAVNAGVDLLLMSPDVKTAARAILDQVKAGTITESRIDESVLRILELKYKRGIL